MLDNLFLQLGPVPETSRHDTPEIELALVCRAPLQISYGPSAMAISILASQAAW